MRMPFQNVVLSWVWITAKVLTDLVVRSLQACGLGILSDQRWLLFQSPQS